MLKGQEKVSIVFCTLGCVCILMAFVSVLLRPHSFGLGRMPLAFLKSILLGVASPSP